MLDNGAGRHGAAVAAAIGDDAEGAAVVTAILYFDKGPRFARKGGHEMRARFPSHS